MRQVDRIASAGRAFRRPRRQPGGQRRSRGRLSGAAAVPVARRADQRRQYGLTRTALSREAAPGPQRAGSGRDRVSPTTPRSWPLTLSGGQAQRVSLARALVAEPELLLLDEPFGALDALTRLSMRALLLDLWRRHGFGVLLVTHDVDEAIELADRVLVLEQGRVAHSITIESPRPAPSERTAKHDAIPCRATRQARRSALTAKVMQRTAFHVGDSLLVLTRDRDGVRLPHLGTETHRGAGRPCRCAELSGVTLQVGDQKGGTEALLRAAHALGRPAVSRRHSRRSRRARRRSRR